MTLEERLKQLERLEKKIKSNTNKKDHDFLSKLERSVLSLNNSNQKLN